MLAKATMLVAGTLATAHAQLYLIAGSLTPGSPQKFGARLLEVHHDGSLLPATEIVRPCPKRVCGDNDGGADWITVSQEAGIAVILGDGRIEVLSLREGAVVKRCRLPATPENASWLGQWLVNLPSDGPVLALDYWEPDSRRSFLRGFRLDTTTACVASAVKLDPSDLRYISALGGGGVAGIGISDGINIGISLDANGDLVNRFGGASVPYGYHVPASFLEGFKPSYAAIGINNSEIMVLGLSDRASNSRVLVFRKRDQGWRSLPLPPQRLPSGRTGPAGLPMRGFGHFVAIVEAQPRGFQNIGSPGEAEWRKGASSTGPDLAYLLKNSRDIYPGRLHLYDVETARQFVIETKQGDSEILLVDTGTVYYRASDRLYSATLTDAGLGPSRLLATDDSIRDAHWAFTKR